MLGRAIALVLLAAGCKIVHVETPLAARLELAPGCQDPGDGGTWVGATLTVTNQTGSTTHIPADLQCWVEREVTDAAGHVVDDFAAPITCATDPEAFHTELAPRGQTSGNLLIWDARFTDSQLAPAGTYTIEVDLDDGTRGNPLAVSLPGCN
ncbi:MAG: hypothetical protein ACM31C_26160 [Acidobacteriota bacterium]